jgi:hypothetical protein
MRVVLRGRNSEGDQREAGSEQQGQDFAPGLFRLGRAVAGRLAYE